MRVSGAAVGQKCERLGDVVEEFEEVERSSSTRWRRARRTCRTIAIDAQSRAAKARIEMAKRTRMLLAKDNKCRMTRV
jgi:hypothetical protein